MGIKNKPLRIVFMGSPVFAVPTLMEINKNYYIEGVVTQPDKPAGRGQQKLQSAIKKAAISLGLEVYQPTRLRDIESVQHIRNWQPDMIVVTAFGQILPKSVLDIPQYGCINVHASLLPRWRGASPIQSAILYADKKSGVTIMKMDAGVDTGPILAQREAEISSEDNALTLSEKLSFIGSNLLIETLPLYIEGKITPVDQINKFATNAPIIKKEEGLLNFDRPAEELECKIRAFFPWPGAFFYWREQPFKVQKAHLEKSNEQEPNKRYIIEKFPAIGTSSHILILDVVQPAGKKSMPGDVFLHGTRDWLN